LLFFIDLGKTSLPEKRLKQDDLLPK